MDTAPFTLEITQDAPAVFHAPPCSGSLDLRLGDCMDVMKGFEDGHFDLAIVDPPYGLGVSSDGGNSKEWGLSKAKGFSFVKKEYSKKDWDSAIPSREYFEELRRVSKEQIVWGANFFAEHLGNMANYVIWYKMGKSQNPKYSDTEFAYCSKKGVPKMIDIWWNGFGSINSGETRIHPTQKPVKLYAWLLERYAKPGQRVLDTHLGSGSIAIAAHYAGIHLTACEIDPDYFHAAKARIARETSQADFFSPQNAKEHPTT